MEHSLGTSPAISKLLQRLASQAGAQQAGHVPPVPQPLIHTAVYATLLWEASTNQAKSAISHLTEAFADFNDVRVAPVSQIVAALGERAPLVTERALRLKAWLNDLFSREQRLALESLRDIKHGQAHEYLLGLDGAPPFVASYVMQSGLGAHYVPVDERLLMLLAREAALPKDATVITAAKLLTDSLPPDSLTDALRVLRWWSDHEGHAPKRESDAFKPQPIAPLEQHSENAPRRTARIRPREIDGGPAFGAKNRSTPKNNPDQ